MFLGLLSLPLHLVRFFEEKKLDFLEYEKTGIGRKKKTIESDQGTGVF